MKNLKDEDERKTFGQKFQESIFFTYHEILETQSISQNMGIILIVISHVQAIGMTFNSFNPQLKVTALSGFLSISDYLTVYAAVRSSSNSLFNYFIQVSGLLIQIFLMWGAYYIGHQRNQQDVFVKSLQNTWGFFYDLSDKVLTIPIYGLSFLNIFCKAHYQCFSVEHIILLFLSVINLMIFFVMQFLYVNIFFNFTFQFKDSLSRNPSGVTQLFWVFRIIQIFLSVQLDLTDSASYRNYCLTHVVLGVMQLFDSLARFPYHQKNVSKAHGIFCACYAWINLTLFGLLIIDDLMIRENILIILGLGLIYFIKLYLNIRNYYSKIIMNYELSDIESDVLVDLKIRTYSFLSKNTHMKKSELLLASLLKIHFDQCSNSECPCQRRQYLYDPKQCVRGDNKKQFHRDGVFVKHFIRQMIQDGSDKFKDSMLLYLDYIFYQFQGLRLYTPIWASIESFKKKWANNMDFSVEFCLYRLAAKMKKHIQEKNYQGPVSEVLLIEDVQEFDSGMNQIKEYITGVCQQYINMWETLQDQIPDLSQLLTDCHLNSELIAQTQIIYNKLKKLNNTSADLKNLMDVYSNYIVYDDLLSTQVGKDIIPVSHFEIGNSINQDIEFILKKYNVYEENACVLSISSKEDNLNQITWVSKNAEQIFLFDSNNPMSGRDINEFMPTVIANCHEKILKNFFTNGKENSINNIMHTWCLDSAGFCFSANIFVQIIPTIQDFEIMGLIHQLNEMDYMILDRDGQISAIGQRVSEMLGLQPQFFKTNQINIQLIAYKLVPRFNEYFMDFQDTMEQALPENQKKNDLRVLGLDSESINQEKFFIIIPKNFRDILSQFSENRKNMIKKYCINTNDKTLHDLKQLYQFKSAYVRFMQEEAKKFSVQQFERFIQVRAQFQIFSFYNGSRMTQLKAMKILSFQNKTVEYMEKTNQLKKHEKILSLFYNECKKQQLDYNKLNQQQQQEEKQQEEQEAEKEKHLEEVNTTTKEDKTRKLIGLLGKSKDNTVGGLFKQSGQTKLLTGGGTKLLMSSNIAKLAMRSNDFMQKQDGQPGKPQEIKENEQENMEEAVLKMCLNLMKPCGIVHQYIRAGSQNGSIVFFTQEVIDERHQNKSSADETRQQLERRDNDLKLKVQNEKIKKTTKRTSIIDQIKIAQLREEDAAKRDEGKKNSITRNTMRKLSMTQGLMENTRQKTISIQVSDGPNDDNSPDSPTRQRSLIKRPSVVVPQRHLKSRQMSLASKRDTLQQQRLKEERLASMNQFEQIKEQSPKTQKIKDGQQKNQNSDDSSSGSSSSSGSDSDSSSNQQSQFDRESRRSKKGPNQNPPPRGSKDIKTPSPDARPPNQRDIFKKNPKASPSNQSKLIVPSKGVTKEVFVPEIQKSEEGQKSLAEFNFEEFLKDPPQTKIPDIDIPYLKYAQKVRNIMFKLKFIGNQNFSDFYIKPRKAKQNTITKPPPFGQQRAKSKESTHLINGDNTTQDINLDQNNSQTNNKGIQFLRDQMNQQGGITQFVNWVQKIQQEHESKTLNHSKTIGSTQSKFGGSNHTTIKPPAEDSSGSSNENDEDDNESRLNFQLVSESHQQSDQLLDQEFRDNLERKEVQEQEIGVGQSVGSSASSLNTQNALQVLRSSLKDQSIPNILKFGNFMVIITTILLFAVSLAQFTTSKSEINDISEQYSLLEKLTIYSQNITLFFNDYMDLQLAQDEFYDQRFYDQQWWSLTRSEVNQRLGSFMKFSLDDLSKAGSDKASGDVDLHTYLFEVMELRMLLNSKPKAFSVNFQNYIRLFTNSINSTIQNRKQFFTYENFGNNDFLYLINANFEAAISQIKLNYAWIQTLMTDKLDYLQKQNIGFMVVTMFFTFICTAAIYPIYMESQIKIHDSLVLFTRISLRDVDFYYDHYKEICLFLQNIEKTKDLMNQTQQFIEIEIANRLKAQMSNDSQSLSRTRQYSGVQVNRLLVFVQMAFICCVFLTFIFTQDFFFYRYTNKLYDYKTNHLNQQKYFYEVITSSYLFQKYMHSVAMDTTTLDAPDLSKIQNYMKPFMEQNLTDIIATNYQIFGDASTKYEQFIQTITTQDICVRIQITQEEKDSVCTKIVEGILQKGVQNFFIQFHNYMENGINLIQKTQESGVTDRAQLQPLAINLLRYSFMRDLRQAFKYISQSLYQWYQVEKSELINENEKEILFSQYMLMGFALFIFTFLFFIWFRIFFDIQDNNKWVNGFIILIPLQLLRDNQYLRSYIKRRLKISNLQYL